MAAAEKSELESKLENQLDDSLKNRITTSFFIMKKLVSPPAFDSSYASRSAKFMKALLKANGFLYGSVSWDTALTIHNNQQRVTTNFTVVTGKQIKIDSVAYNLSDSALQQLALRRENRTLLKKGDPYSKEAVSAELDRMVEVFKNNGYFRFTKESLYAQVDTVVAALLDPSLDPLEQLALLEEVQKRMEKPTINIEIKLRPSKDSLRLKKYYVRNVSIYPETYLTNDSLPILFRDTIIPQKLIVYSSYKNFKPGFIANTNALIPDSLYRQNNYFKTINSFNQLGAWDQSTIDYVADDSLGRIDFVIKLFPGKKYNTKVDLEASRNASDVLTATSLLGIGVNFGLLNRNMNKSSIQTSTNLRFGIEIGKNFIQTLQASFGYNIYFPRFILPFSIKDKKVATQRTILSTNATLTDRRDFFKLQNYSISWGYEWSKRRPNRTWYYSPMNLEFQKVVRTDSLNDLIQDIPNLDNSFKDGFIISQKLIYNSQKIKGNHSNGFKITGEESGGLFGLFPGIDQNAGLFRFVKVDIDYRHFINYTKSSLAFRLYGGIGIPYGKDKTGKTEPTLPVTRSFFAGGPSSMRAWGVRQLGPGSALYLDTLNGGGYDRLGDIQLESNIEYRFNVGTIGGIKIKSALFTDIGNIWLRNNQGKPELDKGVFNFSRLYRDIAVGAGTSLRADFTYFLIRLDWAYKIKNPVYADVNSGWFQNLQLTKGQLQLGINYPF